MSAARKRRKGKKGRMSLPRRIALWAFLALVLGYAVLAYAALAFVHQPKTWRAEREEAWPGFAVATLYWIGNGLGDITDGLGLTGHDVVYDYDTDPPSGSVLFAGAPRRVGNIQPSDITILDRGEFVVGWSPSLRRPVWCAYHVMQDELYQAGKRPNFTKDKNAVNSPTPSAYDHSGYDRGHMVPNHAIESRYGSEEQRKTFMMSNIAPQTPALNRSVWRNLEHRIADFWPARYGEIWVIVGCIPNNVKETISGSDVEVPSKFFQVVVAQEGMDVRAFAVIFDQNVSWREWAARSLVTIDELEEMAGLDFLPDLPGFIQEPLEAELPTRLWPVNFSDIFRLFLLRFN